jgi:hypothetical protein
MVRREIDNNRPRQAILTVTDEPPKLIRGNGIPVKGNVAVTTPILTIA